MSATKLAVGSDIKYFCPKCELQLAHTVLALVGATPARIRCNTCRSERNYRQTKSVEHILKSSTPRSKIVRPDLFHSKIHENIMKTAKTYRIDQNFKLDDVIQHPSFGKGVVIKLSFPDRMEVLFQDQSRVLVCKLTEKIDSN